MQNILDLTYAAFGAESLKHLSHVLQASPRATRRGVEAAMPASLLGLSSFASSDSRAAQLLETLRRGECPRVEPEAILSAVGDPAETSRLAALGENFWRRILGKRFPQVTSALALQSGLSEDAATTVLSLSAPLVLDMVGKEATQRNLDAHGLSRLLRDEGRKVNGLLTSKLSHALHFKVQERGDGSGAHLRTMGLGAGSYSWPHPASAQPERPKTQAWWAWALVPMLLLTAIGIWWFYRVYVDRPLHLEELKDERPLQVPGGLKPDSPRPSPFR